MEQTTPQQPAASAKPVMDVTPPKPAVPTPASATIPPVAATAVPATEPKPAEAPKTEQGPLAVHQAPIDPDAQPDTVTPEPEKSEEKTAESEHRPKAHLPHKIPKTAHTPAAIIAITIMAMIILSGLAVLVYLNA